MVAVLYLVSVSTRGLGPKTAGAARCLSIWESTNLAHQHSAGGPRLTGFQVEGPELRLQNCAIHHCKCLSTTNLKLDRINSWLFAVRFKNVKASGG